MRYKYNMKSNCKEGPSRTSMYTLAKSLKIREQQWKEGKELAVKKKKECH
jgi:hypothetical protein